MWGLNAIFLSFSPLFTRSWRWTFYEKMFISHIATSIQWYNRKKPNVLPKLRHLMTIHAIRFQTDTFFLLFAIFENCQRFFKTSWRFSRTHDQYANMKFVLSFHVELTSGGRSAVWVRFHNLTFNIDRGRIHRQTINCSFFYCREFIFS